MKITLCFIKAEIGSMGGHIYPFQRSPGIVRDRAQKDGQVLLKDPFPATSGTCRYWRDRGV